MRLNLPVKAGDGIPSCEGLELDIVRSGAVFEKVPARMSSRRLLIRFCVLYSAECPGNQTNHPAGGELKPGQWRKGGLVQCVVSLAAIPGNCWKIILSIPETLPRLWLNTMDWPFSQGTGHAPARFGQGHPFKSAYAELARLRAALSLP